MPNKVILRSSAVACAYPDDADLNSYAPKTFTLHSKMQDYIPKRTSRRMSALVRMAVTAASIAAKKAKWDTSPSDARSVFFGTSIGAYKSMLDFLHNLITNKERYPKPASFVSSMQNAATSSVGMHLGCKGENITFTQHSASFYNALSSAKSSLQNLNSKQALIGSGEELSEYLLKQLVESEASDYGEGAGFLALEYDQCKAGDIYIGPVASKRLKKTTNPQVASFIRDSFLKNNEPLNISDTLFLLGANGKTEVETKYKSFIEELGGKNNSLLYGGYKQFTGEFYSTGAIGADIAKRALKDADFAQALNLGSAIKKPIRSVVIYEKSTHLTHSLCSLIRS